MQNKAFPCFERKELQSSPSKITRSLKEYGVVYIDGFEEEIKNASTEFDECFSDNQDAVNRHSGTNELKKIPTISHLLFANEFNGVRHKYLGPFCRKNIEIFTQTTFPTQKPLSGDLHFDRRQTFKIWIYFNDVNIENGPMRVVPQSILGPNGTKQLRKSYGIKDLFNKEINVHRPPSNIKLDVENRAQHVTGSAGTLFLHDTDAWHGASPVQSGAKRLIARSHHRPFVDYFIR